MKDECIITSINNRTNETNVKQEMKKKINNFFL